MNLQLLQGSPNESNDRQETQKAEQASWSVKMKVRPRLMEGCVCVNKFNVQINKIHNMLSSSLAAWIPLPFRSL